MEKLLRENLKNENLIKHCLAVSAATKALASHFQQDEEKWEVCGLLHDIDYEKTAPEEHSKKGSEMLKELGFDKEICEAVLTHNEMHGIKPESLMAKALFCCDPLTGLIVASCLVLPSKKINDLKTENVLKRFKEKSFAKSCNREIISLCRDYLNLDLKDFIEIVLKSMQSISSKLGL